MKFYYVTKIFDLHTFDDERTAFSKFFEICLEIHFVSLFFLNETNIRTSFLIIHLKCTVVHYTDLNSISINKPYVRTVENALSCFFLFLLYVYFNKAFVKDFMEIIIAFFDTNFQNSIQDVVYCRILRCQTFWYKIRGLSNIRHNLINRYYSHNF